MSKTNSPGTGILEEPTTETTYVGLFGRLCKYVPLFDASAPNGWMLAYRSYSRTSWWHPAAEVELVCEKTSDGWNVWITDHTEEEVYQVLPVDALRWNAFGVARDFLEGEALLPADHHSGWDGTISLEQIGTSR